MAKFRSPAKINLFLKVLHKREDGYHELASLFQTIDLFDFLTVDPATIDEFSCSDPSLPTDSSNLVWKAVELFRKKTNVLAPVKIHLEKNIPSEAGLGGGSSNAATTLWALNSLFGHPATKEELKEWSSTIGSDVAFFLTQGTAFCTGRGEILHERPPLPNQVLWIVKPPYGLSTPQVYKQLDVSQLAAWCPHEALKKYFLGEPSYLNDLEIPAFQLKPELKELKNSLRLACEDVLMSGSGTGFFCVNPKTDFSFGSHYFVRASQFVNRSEHSWY